MNKKLWWVLGVVVVVFLVGWRMYRGQKQNELKLGVIFPLSGPASFYGENARNGIVFALEDMKNKTNGKQITLDIEDSQGQPKFGVDAINKLMAEEYHFVVGDQISGVTLAIAPIAEKNKILYIAPGSASPKVTDAGDYIFRTKVSAAVESDAATNFIINNLRIKNVAFLYQNSDYGRGVFGALNNSLKGKGIAVSEDEHFEIGATDMRTQLTKIKASPSSLVLLAGYPRELGVILKQARELGIDKKFFAHSGSMGPDVVKIGAEGAEGLLFLYEIQINKDNPITKSFFDRYYQKLGVDPDLFSMLAYDTTRLFIEKIVQCDQDVLCVKNMLYNTHNYEGITGSISFDSNGDIMRDSFTLLTIKNGRFVSVPVLR